MAKKAIATENQTKVCPRCNRELPLSNYNKGNGKYGHRSICRECEHLIQNTPERRARRRELELKRRENRDYVLHRNEMDKLRRIANPRHWLWLTAKTRAKKRNIEFNISETDFEMPEVCPLLGIPMCRNTDVAQGNSYSLDRIDSSKGYIPGNVWVISRRANAIKSDATLEELELLVKNLRKYCGKDNT